MTITIDEPRPRRRPDDPAPVAARSSAGDAVVVLQRSPSALGCRRRDLRRAGRCRCAPWRLAAPALGSPDPAVRRRPPHELARLAVPRRVPARLDDWWSRGECGLGLPDVEPMPRGEHRDRRRGVGASAARIRAQGHRRSCPARPRTHGQRSGLFVPERTRDGCDRAVRARARRRRPLHAQPSALVGVGRGIRRRDHRASPRVACTSACTGRRTCSAACCSVRSSCSASKRCWPTSTVSTVAQSSATPAPTTLSHYTATIQVS